MNVCLAKYLLWSFRDGEELCLTYLIKCSMLKKIGGVGNLVFLCIFFLVIAYAILVKQNLDNSSCYVLGISNGIGKGAKGNIRLYYNFYVNGIEYTSGVPTNFCSECEGCCGKGDTGIVRYQRGNPMNNDLVVNLPRGVHLSSNKFFCE